ncbi:hypothetical protein EJ02DRAFT_157871 [Clathrospora elynae]|uniref:Alcohol acetyltransferase n=1 Tax=Clathrospora elynae TaxID=706981 RepID=A0A6A5SQD8_9PLEO|nr:hypothetical protein EJ02DRAFT_157871 [Clathrospora elynae]
MTDSLNLEKLRPCGRLETFSTARHNLSFYRNVGFTATYTSSDTPQSPLGNNIFAALRHVIAKYPNLSAITLNEEQSFPNVYFARLTEIDLRTCVEICERRTPFPKDGEADEELDEALAQQHSRDFKEGLGSKPFWRLLVQTSPNQATQFSASWMWHHALADGGSALLFHESFLAGLNASGPDSDAGPIVPTPIATLLQPLEELHPMSMSWPFFLQAILGAMLPSIFAKRPAKLWAGNPVPEDTTTLPTPRYRTLIFSKETTLKLAQASRAERASMTATLQCLLAASLFANLPATEYDKISIFGPISMKRFLDVKETQMTNAIATYDYMHRRPSSRPTNSISSSPSPSHILQNFSWDEARAVKFKIQAEIAKEGRDNPNALLKYVSDMPGFFLEKLGKPRSPSAEVSSLGVWRDKQGGGKWEVGRMVFSQFPDLTAGAFAMNVVTGGDGNAVINFCWGEWAVGEGMMRKVIEGVGDGVEGLIDGYEA